jgi:hypothetical protein
MKRTQKDPFTRIDALMAAFRDVEGFSPNTFVAWAEPEAIARDGDAAHPGGAIVRSFRYEAWGCMAHVTMHGSPRSRWHRRVAKLLMAAGYERWLSFDDETDFRRALTNARARSAELAFLRALGESGDPARWPLRALVPRRDVRVAPNSWTRTIEAVRSSGIAWTDASIGFTRSSPLSTKSGPSELQLRVSALVLPRPSRTIQVSVGLFDPKRNSAEVPAPLMLSLHRALRRGGYRFSRMMGPGGVRVAGRLAAERTMSNATAVARECEQIFERLVAQAREVRLEDR